MRYVGQSYELTIPAASPFTRESVDRLVAQELLPRLLSEPL